jgi:5'-deoxynucleotidase YfbR-like HD superfamily hydrolase
VTESDYLLDTASGRQLDLADPHPDDIELEDIASALSKVCRFGAQAREFYSVAQHAVLVRDLVIAMGRPDLAAAALHHDSHEAFVGDIPAPLKRLLNARADDLYDRISDNFDRAIETKLGIVIPPPHSEDGSCQRLSS